MSDTPSTAAEVLEQTTNDAYAMYAAARDIIEGKSA